jgi:hypothetical protein
MEPWHGGTWVKTWLLTSKQFAMATSFFCSPATFTLILAFTQNRVVSFPTAICPQLQRFLSDGLDSDLVGQAFFDILRIFVPNVLPGRHICPGERFAKIIVKVITVLVLSSFNIDALDTSHRMLDGIPEMQKRIFGPGRTAKPINFRFQSVQKQEKVR